MTLRVAQKAWMERHPIIVLLGEISTHFLCRNSDPPYIAPHMYVHFTPYQEPEVAYGETGFGLTGRSGLDSCRIRGGGRCFT